MEKIKLNTEKIIKWSSWIWFGVLAIIFVVYIVCNINMFIDSDGSSELVLSNLLAKEHQFISKNWFYSTELRVLNTQIIFSILFWFTGSYHFVRIAGTIILALILMLSYYFLLSSIGLKKYFPYTGAFLIAPFSGEYLNFVLVGNYYIPHIAISFVAMGLLFRTLKQKGKRRIVCLALSYILALVSGLGGPRQVIIFYLPLLLTLIWIILLSIIKNKPFTIDKIIDIAQSVFISFICALVGYLINSKLLYKIYTFVVWEGLNFTPFSVSKFEGIINGFIGCMGYKTGPLCLLTLCTNALAAALILGIALYYYKRVNSVKYDKDYYGAQSENKFQESFLAVFFVMASMAMTVLYLFTDMRYEDRYLLPVLVFAFPLYTYLISRVRREFYVVICSGIMVLALAGGIANYKIVSAEDRTAGLRDIAQAMQEMGYETGYATFWNANVITELSDGNIEMYAWTSAAEEVIDVDEVYMWLQKKDHLNTLPDGPVFIVFESSEMAAMSLDERLLSKDNINKDVMYDLYSDGNYHVYGFDNHEAMVAVLSSVSVDLSNDTYVDYGISDGTKWILYENGRTRGPYITLYSGTYLITVHGSNLDECVMYADYEFGTAYEITEVFDDNQPGARTFKINVGENLKQFSFYIENTGKNSVQIDRILIAREYNP